MDEPEACRLCGVNGSVEGEDGAWTAVPLIATKKSIAEEHQGIYFLTPASAIIQPVHQARIAII